MLGRHLLRSRRGHEQSHAEDIAKAMGSTKDQQQFYFVLETLTVMEVWKTDYQPVRKHALRDEVGMEVLDTGCLKTVAGHKKLAKDEQNNTIHN